MAEGLFKEIRLDASYWALCSSCPGPFGCWKIGGHPVLARARSGVGKVEVILFLPVPVRVLEDWRSLRSYPRPFGCWKCGGHPVLAHARSGVGRLEVSPFLPTPVRMLEDWRSARSCLGQAVNAFVRFFVILLVLYFGTLKHRIGQKQWLPGQDQADSSHCPHDYR